MSVFHNRVMQLLLVTCSVCSSMHAAAQDAPAAPAPGGAQQTEATPPASDVTPSAAANAAPAATTDIDTAADTVSDVASLTSAPSADIDLAALGLDTGVADDALQIYGFAAFSFTEVPSADRQVINQFLAKEGSFFISDLNVYLAKNFSEKWRMMIETRLTYAPNGRVLPDGTIEPNRSYDQGLLGRLANWGGINIERAYLEYDIHPSITIQAGSFLTPYGIWNVDHGAPAIIPFVRPYVLVEQLFPERQAGIHVHGRIPLGSYVIGYDATLSNGRGYFDQFRDLDDTKAIGARLQLETPWLGAMRFGASIYQGRFVDRDSDKLVPNPATMTVDNVTPDGIRYDELAIAADFLYQWKGLHFQAEIVGRNFSYLEGAREPDGSGFRPDSYSVGGYALVGYRFPVLWNVMPFFIYQHYKREEFSGTALFSALENYQTGLNFRPLPTVVLKLQFGQSWIPGGKPPIDEDVLTTLAAQAAWVF